VIMAVPDVTAVTVPVEEPIVALAVLLIHVPPVVPSVRVVVSPEHTYPVPLIAVGVVFTVIVVDALQPVPSV